MPPGPPRPSGATRGPSPCACRRCAPRHSLCRPPAPRLWALRAPPVDWRESIRSRARLRHKSWRISASQLLPEQIDPATAVRDAFKLTRLSDQSSRPSGVYLSTASGRLRQSRLTSSSSERPVCASSSASVSEPSPDVKLLAEIRDRMTSLNRTLQQRQ